jgi:hypothetical protein
MERGGIGGAWRSYARKEHEMKAKRETEQRFCQAVFVLLPRRQYVINLDAPNKIAASDGETRIIGVGEIILMKDVHRNGHLSQAVGQMRRPVMIPIE